MLQPSNARLLQTKSWQSCPGVVVQLYRRHVVQRHHAEVSVVAVTVCAAGASGTWDIYSQIASRLKSLQARYAADHCRHVDRKVSCERLGRRATPRGRAVLVVQGGKHEQRIMRLNDLRLKI